MNQTKNFRLKDHWGLGSLMAAVMTLPLFGIFFGSGDVVPISYRPTNVSFVSFQDPEFRRLQEKKQEKQDQEKKAKPEPTAQQLEFFEKKIRPALVKHCYECHSSGSKSLQAGLQCDSRAALLEGGDSGEAIIPGDSEGSLLIESLKYESYEMPPKGKLPDSVIADFEKWIEMGAPWPEEVEPETAAGREVFDVQSRKESHWAWQPIKQPEVPGVLNKSWPKQDLDHFILKRLEDQGLIPAAENDRRSLARRLFFDITGLPPTPEQMEEFLADSSEKAIENLVDRLLASPRFGERWGRHWLDLVRYAESRGHEFDNDSPNAFQYRDYIIRAFNSDIPYDQLVREHLAGDLLEQPRLNPDKKFNESILGTGFWFFGEWVHAPVDILKDESDRFDNMIDVTTKTFLGMTVSCARCHDHKFDAISTDDYYSLTGFLHSAEYRQVRFESIEENRKVSKLLVSEDRQTDKNLRIAFAKILDRNRKSVISFLASVQFHATTKTKEKKRKVTEQSDTSNKKSVKKKQAKPRPVRYARPVLQGEAPEELEIAVDYSSLNEDDFHQDGFSFRDGPVMAGTMLLNPKSGVTIQTLSAAVSDPSWNGLISKSEPIVTDRSHLRRLPRSGRTLYSPKFVVNKGSVSALVRGGGHFVVCVDSHRMIAPPLHANTVRTVKNDNKGELQWVTFNLSRYIGHSVNMEFTPLAGKTLEVHQIVQGPSRRLPYDKSFQKLSSMTEVQAKRFLEKAIESLVVNAKKGERKAVKDSDARIMARLVSTVSQWSSDGSLAKWNEQIKNDVAVRKDITGKIKKESRVAMAMIDSSGEEARVMIRGNSSKLGDVVPRRFLSALDGLEKMPIKSGSGRLELAAKINADDNPLTSRVIVNRVWHHMLGRGIVPTTDNFGVLGMKPTHPLLLDHLAVWFNNNGKSIKKLIKYIASSSVYQMGSQSSLKGMNADPGNQFWHYNPPKRLQGESIRDAILAVSGSLNEKMFGTAVKIHLTDFMTGRGRPGKSGPLDGDGRRSIYVAVRRNFVSPFQLAFDMPVPFSSMGRRNVSNVPAQALILLNHPLVLQSAKKFADRAVKLYPQDSEKRIGWLYETAFARAPNKNEMKLALKFVNVGHEGERERWVELAHTLFNVKEFIFLR